MTVASPTIKATAILEHRSPGRVRARIQPADRSRHQMELLRDSLASHPAVAAVEVNHETGSVLVKGERTDDLHAALSELVDFVKSATGLGESEPGVEATVELVKRADARVRDLTNGRLSIRMLIPAAFIGIGIRQLLIEGLTIGAIPWYVLIYYGVDSFLKLYPHYAPKAPEPGSSIGSEA